MHAGTRPFPDATSFGLPYQSEKKQLQISFLLPATLLELELLTSLVPHTDFRAKLLQVIDNSWVWLHKANPDDYRFLQSKTKPVSQTSSPRHDDDSLDIKHWDDSISHWLQRQTWTYLQTSEILCIRIHHGPCIPGFTTSTCIIQAEFWDHKTSPWQRMKKNMTKRLEPISLWSYDVLWSFASSITSTWTRRVDNWGHRSWRPRSVEEFDTLISWKCRMSCRTLWGDSEMIHNDLKPQSPGA